MKSLMWLYDGLLTDVSNQCGTSTHRDFLTLSRRIEFEGVSFLTITLPNFCRDFERSLDEGQVGSERFRGFRRRSALPAFLRGLLSQVFDPWSGVLLERPSLCAISAIRQICLMAKKVLLPCSTTRTKGAFNAYVQVESELEDRPLPEYPRRRRAVTDTESFAGFVGSSNSLSGRVTGGGDTSGQLLATVQFVSGVIWSKLGDPFHNLEFVDRAILPRHGPGATAESVSGNAKYRFLSWHQRLEEHFPFSATGIPSLNALDEECIESIEYRGPEAEQPVRVISVPKTLTKPRIIAIEPVCMQYTQQAISSYLVERCESIYPLAGHVNFSDQSINRTLALESSSQQHYATVDLSDASDRVSAGLVYDMLSCVPRLRDAIFACRSTRAELPDGRTVHLKKFASMGSALCFPVEALVFYILCISARIVELKIPLTSKSVFSAGEDVYVYGDDIVIPVDEVPCVARCFEVFGLRINENKTFGIGKFRESCGLDAYDGVDVTPVYLRRLPPSDMQASSEIVSAVSFANQLYKRGWWTIARRVRELVSQITGPLPHVRDTSPGLGWVSFKEQYTFSGYDDATQSPKVKTLVPKSVWRVDHLNGYPALLKCLLRLCQSPNQMIDARHLERSVRPGCVALTRRWVQPY